MYLRIRENQKQIFLVSSEVRGVQKYLFSPIPNMQTLSWLDSTHSRDEQIPPKNAGTVRITVLYISQHIWSRTELKSFHWGCIITVVEKTHPFFCHAKLPYSNQNLLLRTDKFFFYFFFKGQIYVHPIIWWRQSLEQTSSTEIGMQEMIALNADYKWGFFLFWKMRHDLCLSTRRALFL